MSAVIIDDQIVHYEVLGRGRPLIFLHGWVGSWRYWIPAMQATSISYRSYALDLWGFGDSAKKEDCYNLEDQVKLVDRFLEELGVAKVAIVGHGLGAIIGMLYAQKFPRFVDRVMTISMPLEKEAIHERLQNATTPVEIGEWLLNGTDGSENTLQETPKTDAKAITRSIENIANLDIRKLAVELSIPCLLVHGKNDKAITSPSNEQFDSLSELSHHIIFEEAGHYPMLNEPNKFNRLLADFLSLNSGESPRQLQLKEEWKRRLR